MDSSAPVGLKTISNLISYMAAITSQVLLGQLFKALISSHELCSAFLERMKVRKARNLSLFLATKIGQLLRKVGDRTESTAFRYHLTDVGKETNELSRLF